MSKLLAKMQEHESKRPEWDGNPETLEATLGEFLAWHANRPSLYGSLFDSPFSSEPPRTIVYTTYDGQTRRIPAVEF